ncbi:MAG: DUF4492 domain-containing protein [Hoylesella marshii]|nr:DUF4492 domain-containing protein [Hoylesella marshii]
MQTTKRSGFFYRVFDLYYDGFTHMTLGKTLWTIIIIKLLVMFLVLKLFFFPNFLKEHAQEGEEAKFVGSELIHRSVK